MKKHLFFLLFFTLMAFNNFAQTTFQKDIGLTFDTSFIRCLPDGKAAFVVGQINENNQLHTHFLKVNNNGDLLWHKEFYVPNLTYEIKNILVQNDGLLALFSAKDSAFLLKINFQDGSVLWRKDFGQNEKMSLYDMASDDKENIWLGGLRYKKTASDSSYYFHLKLDKNGAPIMAKQTRTYSERTSDLTTLDYRIYKATNLLWIPQVKSMLMVQDYPNDGIAKAPWGGGSSNLRSWFVLADSAMQYQEYDLPDDVFDWVMSENHVSFAGSVNFPSLLNIIGLINPDIRIQKKMRYVDGKMHAIHNHDGSIVFYNMKYKTLTKYNEQLTPIWSKKYDNCYNTTNFEADIARDGSIFTVRNVAQKTIVSRINADGTLPNCVDYTAKSYESKDTLVPERAFIRTFYNADYALPIIKDNAQQLLNKNATLTDYCLKIDAAFQLPDTMCIGSDFKPKNVDTVGAKHAWEFRPNFSELGYPTINYATMGLKKVLHQLQKGLCKDSFSTFVFIIPEPKINVNDTIICGKKDVEINLTTPFANNYFLNNQLIKPIKTIDSSGSYTLKITTKDCFAEKKIKIKINNYAIPEFKQIGLPCQGESYPIVFDKVFKNIIWDNKLIKNDTIFITNSLIHNYNLIYSLDTNCVVKGSVKINRSNCTDVFIPNVFSPNNDQINDEFKVFSKANYNVLKLSVFDRWGEPVFTATGGNSAWNGQFKGQNCAEGVYIYVAELMNLTTLKTEILSGDVALMR
jgi:gliding motility-associated-like protein